MVVYLLYPRWIGMEIRRGNLWLSSELDSEECDATISMGELRLVTKKLTPLHAVYHLYTFQIQDNEEPVGYIRGAGGI
jgi:hypothetical protein